MEDAGDLVVDNTDPTVTASALPAMVADGGEVTITATVSDGTGSGIDTVTADVSMLDTTQTDPVMFTDGGDGTHTYSLTINSGADDGPQDITVMATDAAGNEADDTATVTLDNTAPVITAPSRGDETPVMAGDTVEISAMVEGATSVSADVSMSECGCTDAFPDGRRWRWRIRRHG